MSSEEADERRPVWGLDEMRRQAAQRLGSRILVKDYQQAAGAVSPIAAPCFLGDRGVSVAELKELTRLRMHRELVEREAARCSRPFTRSPSPAPSVSRLQPGEIETEARSLPTAIRLTARLGLPDGRAFQPSPFSRDPSLVLVTLRPIHPSTPSSGRPWSPALAPAPSLPHTPHRLSSRLAFDSALGTSSVEDPARLVPPPSRLHGDLAGRLSQISFLNDLSDSVAGVALSPLPSLSSPRSSLQSSSPDEVGCQIDYTRTLSPNSAQLAEAVAEAALDSNNHCNLK